MQVLSLREERKQSHCMRSEDGDCEMCFGWGSVNSLTSMGGRDMLAHSSQAGARPKKPLLGREVKLKRFHHRGEVGIPAVGDVDTWSAQMLCRGAHEEHLGHASC